MAKHIWSVLCRRGIIDQLSNVVSLQEVIEELTIHGELPPYDPASEARAVIPTELNVVSYWVRNADGKKERPQQRVCLVSPKNEVIADGIVQFDLDKFEQARNIVGFQGLPYFGLGKYWIRVEIEDGKDNWKEVISIPFNVKHAPIKKEAN